MKKIVFFCLMCFLFCSQVSRGSDSTAYYKAKYEIALDSIAKLKQRPVMTKQQYLDLYKYERLKKYYKICKARPVNWKYYKGWSTRVFESK